MASNFRIQKPYELTSLPKSLDQAADTHVVGDVFGQSPGEGSKKRKRSELTVGINGEALNIYNVTSSRLITSYPIPPQAAFTCPPFSLRWKSPASGTTRYTYASTREPRPKITLYKDATSAEGSSASTTVSKALPKSVRVVHLTSTQPANSETSHSLITVAASGTISCLDGESLEQNWQASPSILKQDTGLPTTQELRIEFAQTAAADDVVNGFFGGNDNQLKLFLPEAEEKNNADILVLLSSASVDGKEIRHVHIAAVSPTARGNSNSHGVIQLLVAPLPTRPVPSAASTTYRLDVASGSLVELHSETMTSYDVSLAVPRIESQLQLPNATSFLRLSKTSVLVATPTELAIYNPLYRSLQVSAPIEPVPKQTGAFKLVAYFAKLEMAIALCGSSFMAVQLEAPKNRNKKRRAEGLLIDSIGRGVVAPVANSGKTDGTFRAKTFSTHAPPSLESNYGLGSWIDDAKQAEQYLETGDFAEFEKFMAFSFQVHCIDGPANDNPPVDEDTPMETNGDSAESGSTQMTKDSIPQPRRALTDNGNACWIDNGRELPIWLFPEQIEPADRRMVIHTISRVFTVVSAGESNLLGWKLKCRVPWSGVLQYLALTGHLSIANLQMAIQVEHSDLSGSEDVLSEQLPPLLAEIDPTLDLLLTWLSTTKLGPVEIFAAVKIIMQSLELIQDPKKMTRNLLTSATNGTENGNPENGDFGMELDQLEEDIHVMEHYLGDDTGIRVQGLSVAFGKLGSCPAVANVRAIRQIFKPEETLSLIYLLRMELTRDGWTTRYLDRARLAEDDEAEAVPDSSIQLVADLLCQCIDSVGPGGWLINDMLSLAGAGASDQLDSADFLNSMKLEVSAALEGIEEAVYLRGVLTEVVKYGSALSKTAAPAAGSSKTIAVVGGGQFAINGSSAGSMLPLGPKASRQAVSRRKIVSGGEVRERTSREIGHLTSKKVADYTFERILV